MAESNIMSEKQFCDSCIHKSYPTGQRYEYFENNDDIYIRDNLTGGKFFMSDLNMLCNLLNNYDTDWQRKRVERALEIQKEYKNNEYKKRKTQRRIVL